MTPQARLLALLLTIIPLGAWAHAGHDHADTPKAVASTSTTRTSYAVSHQLELLARWPLGSVDESVPFQLLLSDFATNAPIAGAEISLSFSGEAEAEGTAIATATPGIYLAHVVLSSDGDYDLIATVTTNEGVELLALEHIRIGPDETSQIEGAESAHGRGFGPLAWGGIVALFVGGAFAWRKRVSKRVTPGALSGALLLGLAASSSMAPTSAIAHAGHDHEPTPSTGVAADPSAPLFLAKESQFLLGVRSIVAEERRVTDRVRSQGKLVAPPDKQAPLFAPQAGRLLMAGGSFPTLGSRVQKGDVLAVVDAALSAGERASFAAEAANALASSRRAEAQLEAAQRQLARLEGLEGIVARQEVELAEVDVRSAEAEFAAARTAKQAFDGSSGAGMVKLLSPIDGILADIGATPGEFVDPQRRIFLVVDSQELWVEASLFEADLASVEHARDAVATVEAYPGEPFTGEFLGSAHVVDSATRTLKAIFRLPNPGGRLKVGMFAEIAVASGDERTGLALPESAISEMEGKKIVFVREGPEEFSVREVATGARDGAWVEITAGLQAGERVVVSGTYTLRNAPQAAR